MVPRVTVVLLAISFGCFAQAEVKLPVAASDPESPFTVEEREHWAYQPVTRPNVPATEDGRWAINPVDSFVLASLEAAGLKPSARANRAVLIRRATLDLHGLPPTPDEVEQFVGDTRPNAYEHLIDRLLASPRYGERWARHWLDVARYAESDGYKSDLIREGAWHYRDYVIRSLNDDKPYDRFLSEQLAGDELWPEQADALIATGFLRHWPYEDNGRDLDRQWASILNDVTDVTGQVFLGMTVRCARCHDHKFDAILQKDYFRLQSFFIGMLPENDLPIGTNDQLADYSAQLDQWRSATSELRAEQHKLESPFFQKQQRSQGTQFPPLVQAILDLPTDERTPYQQQLVHLAGKMLRVDRSKMAKRMDGDVRKRWNALNKRLGKFDNLKPKNLPVARGIGEIGVEAPPTRIPGDDDSPPIEPGFLSVIDPTDAIIEPPTDGRQTTGRRSSLVRWMTDDNNPLTARVIVNRLWQHHFGRGIVGTSGDFGVMGDAPTHPLLLDYLATELRDNGWRLKQIHRLIMTSATYRQTSNPDNDTAGSTVDPDNRLIWRSSVRRVEAEVIRDSILALSDNLNYKMHGESVLPELPKGISARYGWKPTPDVAERDRRSVYLVVKRNVHLPLLKTFDVPDNHDTCMRRDNTTTPTQALILMNDNWPLQQARSFAARLVSEVGSDPKAVITQAYRIAYSRKPDGRELATGMRFLNEQAQMIRAAMGAGDTADKSVEKALVDYCHTLFNSNEFVYVD